MRPAVLWLQIFGAGFALIVALLVLTLATPTPYGDLSRLGRLSDQQFGWLAPPPRVDSALLQGVALNQADILVLGDSFSMSHRWQSTLVAHGYRVATGFWGLFGDVLCDDFDQWLADAGFQGKLVIIQSVERLLPSRLEDSAKCRTMRRPLRAKEAPFLEPLETLPPATFNWTAPLLSGWITWRNTEAALASPGDTLAEPNTRARVVPNGCELFSNRLCRKALFFSEDDVLGEIAPRAVEHMRDFSRAHPAVPILWMIIPNKTTVYLEPSHSKGFAEAFARSGLGPDLFSFTMSERNQVKDFYFPNDTHLSMHGQLKLGARMLAAVEARLPPPRTTRP
ncbi:MAG: hypothetical protein ABIW85_08300 [Variovorax sp.]